MYQERLYRHWIYPDGLTASHVCEAESDLLILAGRDVTEPATDLLREVRADLEAYILRDETFLRTRTPHETLPGAPLIARRMAAAGAAYGVGPMAAVAGAIAESVGERIPDDVVVENGGDIYARSARALTYTLYAGDSSPFTGKLRFTVRAGPEGVGVCTSSGTVGHSHSEGRADAVCVVARHAAEADAAATALGNRVRAESDIDAVVGDAADIDGIDGILVAAGERIGLWGCVRIAP